MARAERLDLIEFPNWDGLGLAYQTLGPTPTVVRLHTSALETQLIDGLPDSRRLRWDVRRERWQARRAAALVTHSAAHRRTMADELGVPMPGVSLVFQLYRALQAQGLGLEGNHALVKALELLAGIELGG